MSADAKIAVVEDEEELAFTLEFNLQAEGYQVSVMRNASEALAAFEQPQFDLYLLDMMLPDGSGLELCQFLRDRNVRAPILFLTAKNAVEHVVEGLAMGADDYITKPFALAELLGRVSAQLRRRAWFNKPSSTEDVVRIGTTEINFQQQQAVVGDNRVQLTTLETNLLRYFLDNPQRIVTRAELLEKVWGVSGSTETRSVDIFVGRLRRLLESDATQPVHLLTIRGAGYRFVP